MADGFSTSRASGTFSVQTLDPQVLARKLSVGATVNARILESHGNNKYTVAFAGLKMVADSTMPLTVGTKINVQVAALEPKIHFKIVPEGKPGLDQVLRDMGFSKPTDSLRELARELMDAGLPLDAETLKDALAATRKDLTAKEAVRLIISKLPLSQSSVDRSKSSDQSVAAALERLTEQLKASGRSETANEIRDSLTFKSDLKELFDKHPLKQERRLLGESPQADVKSTLIELAQSAKGSPENAEVATAAGDLLKALEGHYLLGTPEPHIPFIVEDEGARDAEISAQRSGEMTHVRFSLDTSKLGNVLGVVDLQKRAVGIALGVTDKESRAALLAAVPELSQNLAALGFSIDSLTVDVLNKAQKELPRRAKTGLDIKI